MPSQANSSRQSSSVLLLSAGLVALTVLAYCSVLGRGGWIWDDDVHVTQNAALTQAHGLWRIWAEPGATPQYYPLVFSSFWVQHHLWGNHALGYHVVNVLLHASSACLLWVILRRAKIPGGQTAAWLAAALFAIHPLQVESVAWISELKNVQSGFFYLAALWAYLNFAGAVYSDGAVQGNADLQAYAAESRPRSQGFWYAACMLLYVAALLSKTVACSLPAAILLLEWWKLGRITWRTVGLVVPMVALGALAGWGTAYMEATHVIKVHTPGDEWDIPFVERLLIAGRAVVFYAEKLVCPLKLTFSYERWTLDRKAWADWAYVGGVGAVLGLLLAFCRKIGRGPFAALAFFVAALFPALGFINIYPMRYSFVADHFQYLACIGLFVFIAAVLGKLLGLLDEADRWLGRIALAPLLGALVILTFRQGGIYSDQETLWRDTVAKNSSSWLGWENLAVELRKRAQVERDAKRRNDAISEAIIALKKTLDLRDDDTNAYCSLGQIYAETRDWELAADAYGHGLSLDPDHVMLLVSYANLNNIQGKYKKAQKLAEHALELAPDHVPAHTALGTALVAQGSLTAAEGHLRRAVQLDPHSAWALNSLAALLIAEQKDQDATEFLRRAVALEPRFAQAQNNLGLALRRSGAKSQVVEAVEHFRAALKELPRFQEARHNLAMTLVELGETEQAIAEYRIMIGLKPEPLECGELAELLSSTEDVKVRNLPEAIALAEQACTMTDNHDISMLRLLAQCLADDQRYDEAIAKLRLALRVAVAQPDQKALVEDLNQQIDLYRTTLLEKVKTR